MHGHEPSPTDPRFTGDQNVGAQVGYSRLAMARLSAEHLRMTGAKKINTIQFKANASMPLETHQRAHRHVELAQFLGAAEFRQVNDETGGEHFGAEMT